MKGREPPTHPHPDDLTLHALGLLAEPARQALVRHVRGCSPCRWTTRALVRVAAALPLAIRPVRPPSRLRARVLGRVRADGPSLARATTAGGWEPLAPGIVRRRLGGAEDGATAWLVRVAPGARFPGGVHEHTEHCFVVAGSIRVGAHRLETGDWARVPAGSVTTGRAVSEEGCLLLVTELG